MAKGFSLYPTIDSDFKAKLGIHHSGVTLSYERDGVAIDLNAEAIDSTGFTYTVTDHKNIWDPEDYEIEINKTYTINNPSFLFGRDGVCPKNGVIGLAMIWSSKGTNSRGVIQIGDIEYSFCNEIEYFFNHTFPKGSLRNSLDLELIIYLKDRGKNIEKDEKHLANHEGLTLGVLDNTRVIIDGTASMFPIVTVEEPSQPLWWVNLDFIDPTEDPFTSEFVSIKINRAHKDYKKLESDAGITGNPLLIEIMASAVQIIVNSLKSGPYWDNILSANQITQGSIAEAVHYILDVYELEDLDEENFARALRLKLGER